MRHAPLLPVLLALSACYADPPPDRARGFTPFVSEDVRVVLFAPDGIRPAPEDAAGLTAIARARPSATYHVALPAEGRPEDAAAVAERRLVAIRAALLERPVLVTVGGPGAPPRGEARLTVQERLADVPAACLGPTEPWRRPFVPWFGQEGHRALLPAGCAGDLALRRQVERPADLTAGRAMQGAPATPAARAVERYIFRDEYGEPTGRAPLPNAGRGGSETDVPADTARPGAATGTEPPPSAPTR